MEFIFWLLVATLAALSGFTNIHSAPYKEIEVHCRDDIWCVRVGECYKFPAFWCRPEGYKLLQTRTSESVSDFRVKKDWKEVGVKILKRTRMMFLKEVTGTFQEIRIVIMKKVRKECDLFLVCLGDYQIASRSRGKSPWLWFAGLFFCRTEIKCTCYHRPVGCFHHCLRL